MKFLFRKKVLSKKKLINKRTQNWTDCFKIKKFSEFTQFRRLLHITYFVIVFVTSREKNQNGQHCSSINSHFVLPLT
jgi:hypothetical protein